MEQYGIWYSCRTQQTGHHYWSVGAQETVKYTSPTVKLELQLELCLVILVSKVIFRTITVLFMIQKRLAILCIYLPNTHKNLKWPAKVEGEHPQESETTNLIFYEQNQICHPNRLLQNWSETRLRDLIGLLNTECDAMMWRKI